jgi:hypothetical protein
VTTRNAFIDEDDLSDNAREGLDASARAVLLTESPGFARPFGVVLDAAVFEGRVDPDKRYAAVVRAPTGYILVGRYASDPEASDANTAFYDGMRQLVGAV